MPSGCLFPVQKKQGGCRRGMAHAFSKRGVGAGCWSVAMIMTCSDASTAAIFSPSFFFSFDCKTHLEERVLFSISGLLPNQDTW